MADLNAAYRRFVETLRTHADIASALRLLEWDHETYLPAGAIYGMVMGPSGSTQMVASGP